MLTKILIANRGEIACRVMTTARRLGIRTVAVYSEADANARHVAMADEAIAIGPAAARESYLNAARIVQAALHSGAQALHPGYGFLSENAAFAQACVDAGLVFIGPPPAAIRTMGNKSAAKALMQAAHVPLLPGYHAAAQDLATLNAEAARIGYPLLIKASSGGGGKGMRIVHSADEFATALAACQREAQASFGDATVLLEKYLPRARHIEIQVFTDTHGQGVSLFERDCSVQRRHQKIIEEAPAPGMDAARRQAMGQAALNAALAVGYVGAGTVEFIVAADGAYYFMEMNTRLQVEHPVTEMVTGFDLVEWQLRVAAGEALPVDVAAWHQVQPHGHALEARLYAENPDQGFLPAVGTLRHLFLPEHVRFVCAEEGAAPPAAVRIDSGVRAGDTLTPHYDPMIAKLIVWGVDRAQALARMRAALAQVHIVGVSNNVDFLTRLLHNASFNAADLDTGLIEREHADLFPAPTALPLPWLALACARLLADEAPHTEAWLDPWRQTRGWRLHGAATRTLQFRAGENTLEVTLEYGAQYALRVLRHQGPSETMTFGAGDDGFLALHLGARRVQGRVLRAGQDLHVFLEGRHQVLTLLGTDARHATSAADAIDATGPRTLRAPMPGKVMALNVAPNQAVPKGAVLLVLEAMKMEHTVVAPTAGQVSEFLFAAGDQVSEGDLLLKFSASS